MANVQKEFRVLTVSRPGSLLIPRDADIPVAITPSLRGHLDQWRAQWPEAAPGAAPGRSDLDQDSTAGSQPPMHTVFKKVEDFLQYYDVIKTATGTARPFVVANVKGAELDPRGDGQCMVAERLGDAWTHR